MGLYVAKRLLSGVFVLWCIITLSFFVMRLAPGGPFDQDRALPPQVRANLEERFGLNGSLLEQYGLALSRYARLDFGVTFTSNGQRTVLENIKETFPVSVELGIYALCIALLAGVGAGLVAGSKPNTPVDYTVMSLAMTGVSVPSIVLGPLLIILFVMHFRLVDYGGWGSWQVKVLPSLTLGLVYAASFARLTRGGMLEIIRQDYIRTARAKGLGWPLVIRRHALRGAILPTVTYLGPTLASLLTGSVVVERVFNVPGISEYFVTGAINRDYPMVMGVVVLYSGMLVILNLCVDLAYTLLDPRVRLE